VIYYRTKIPQSGKQKKFEIHERISRHKEDCLINVYLICLTASIDKYQAGIIESRNKDIVDTLTMLYAVAKKA